jgi:hypothetical protein
MALTDPDFVQPLANDRTNLGKIVVFDVTFDSSYSIGGEAFEPHSVGLSEVWFASIVQIAPVATTTLVFRWDHTNNKIVASWVDTTTDGAPLAEVVDTTSLATYTVRCFFYGLGV